MRNYKLIDTFIFGGELEILKMRLDYLYDSVDYFIFSESNKTHNGKEKDLIFLKNFKMFEKYRDKIKYVIYEPDTSNMNFVPNPEDIFKSDLWKTERGQRSSVKDKVVGFSDSNTMILHSDCDEFPDKTKFDDLWEMVKDLNMEVVSLGQPTYYYSPLNLLELDWYGTVAFNHQTLINLADYFSVRENRFQSRHLDNAGFHFSFFSTPEQIQYKIQTYAHQEFNSPENTDLNNIKNKMYNGQDVLNRPDVKIKKLNQVSDNFPIEFYRHEVFFRNTFDRKYLKPQMKFRRDESMQIPLEIENLQLEINNHNPKVIVEIGSAKGGTLARWFEIPSVETIISIDLPDGIHGGQGFQERTYVISDAIEQSNLIKKEFYAINGNSKDPYIINRLEELLNGRKIDFLFIDGDHTYSGVKEDFTLYERFLSKNAIVGFHDIIDSQFHREVNCYVSAFWNELKEMYEEKEFVFSKHFDREMLSFFYDETYHKGGFGGIGVIKYNKKKVKITPLSLVVPIYNNIDDVIKNVSITLSSSKHIDQVILYSNGTTEEGNQKLKEFAQSNPIIELHIKEYPIGYIKAVNESFKLCKNELIVCLNSDANLYYDWEDRLLPYCHNPRNGVIGPVKVRNFILGCCFIVKKSIINKIGMLDEGFGLGYEDDVEFSERVVRNGYDLGYCCFKNDFGWDSYVDFPIKHVQGISFKLISENIVNELVETNKNKNADFIETTNVKVLKDLDYEEVLSLLNEDEVFIVVNRSGDNFEKIRYDERIIKLSHIFECTKEMDINVLITSLTKEKISEVIEKKKNIQLTWLAKFDDHSSMGILSQKVIENLQKTNVSCKEIIGKTETNNPLIKELINKPNNYGLGIMFSYPDMINELNEFKTKVIYTGVDSTGGIPNFADNANKADFLLTPSNRSKKRMIDLGVTKPIFVFPHGIDVNRFKFKEKKKEDIFKFLYVGEASDRKGTFQLLKAFVDLFKNNSKVELHIKSNSDMIFYEGEKIKKIINENSNIFWDVSNEGHDRVLELYDECHAYVYPSRADTFGMTIIEAMACGLPVISTKEPGVSELIEDRYYKIRTKDVPVVGHPWMLGNWGEPNINDLKQEMMYVYKHYDEIISSGKLEENSNFIKENYSWEKVVSEFENNVLPQLKKEVKIITLLTSYNRPHHIKNVINSLKEIKEDGYKNDIYIVDNTNDHSKDEVLKTISDNIDENFKVYISDFNLGQRGALLQLFEEVNIDDYDFIQFTDQDNILIEPLSTYCDILYENKDIKIVTGYMSKEHSELGWRKTRFGNLCEKRSLRAGHMFMSVSYLKSLFPLHLDSQYNQPWNSSWYAGLDWELTYWNNNSIGKKTDKNFVLCVPGGVIHKGIDSTFYEWNVEENEYPLNELKEMRVS